MSGTKKLLDSNIIIYLSKKELEITTFLQPEDDLHISVISYMEVLGYPFSSKKEEEIITNLCNSFILIYLDNEIISKVINLRKRIKIKLPDAIIAATALVNDLELVTRNLSDFESLNNELILIDPFNK